MKLPESNDDLALDPTTPWVEDTTSELGWDAIRWSYARGGLVEPLEQIIRLAKLHGVKSVLIERRYFDPDWRSMYSKFYGTLFEDHSSTCHRLHFFSEILRESGDLSRFQAHYKGYSVLRPIPSHPVGRTMILPPPGLKRAMFCLATEKVRPLGYELEIEAMPFMSQDGEYMRCSHVVQWTVLYHAHLLRNFSRWLPEEIHAHSQNGLVVGRQVPSGGLSLSQVLSSLHSMGISADKVVLPHDSRERSRGDRLFSLPSTLCRYVNSQMPPIVVSDGGHAWVVVGYRSEGDGQSHDETTLYIHDDMAGPYLEVPDPWAKDSSRGQWELAVPPLPQRLYLSADRAEFVGRVSLMRAGLTQPRSQLLAQAIDDQRLTFRTYAIRSNEFKAALKSRGLPAELCAYYRQASWPGFVWIVEAIDKTMLGAGEQCVMGEAVIDSTATHLDFDEPRSSWPARAVLAVHVPGKAAITKGAGFSEPEPFEEQDERLRRFALQPVPALRRRSERRPTHYLEPLESAQDYFASGCPHANW